MIGDNLKFKKLSLDELIISLDRLSRFKLPEVAYKRVIYSIITKNLISPKYSKLEIEELPVKLKVKVFERIWNESVYSIYGKQYKPTSSKALKFLINCSFKNYDEETKALISSKIIIEPILKELDYDNSSCNLKYLIKTYMAKSNEEIWDIVNRENLKFPIRKLLIVEGITEENLLPEFANKLNLNFDKYGIFVLGAGGKSKSPSLYLELRDKLKIPVVLLFDKDATEIAKNLQEVILPKDKIIVIEQGEFEDILSLNLLKRTLNKEYEPVTKLSISELKESERMCLNIEEFYKRRHLGEFKIAKLSKLISENISYSTDISTEIKGLINSIIF